jgi:hypothetical protein
MPWLDRIRRARLLTLGIVLAAAATCGAEPESKDAAATTGDCVIVDYKSSTGGTYTWYYCPSSRIFVKAEERRITDFDTGIETRVSNEDRKVRTLPLRVPQEARRADLRRRESASIAPTGKTDTIAGVRAVEYLFRFTYGGRSTESRSWFAADVPVPGRDKALATDADTELAPQRPSGVLLRAENAEATSVRRGTPPASVLAIPADYEKLRWSDEKRAFVADGK